MFYFGSSVILDWFTQLYAFSQNTIIFIGEINPQVATYYHFMTTIFFARLLPTLTI